MDKNTKQIGRNAFYLYILTFSNYFLSFLLLPYLSRTLSVEGFGLIGFSATFVLFFQSLIEFGFMISATALIAKNRSNHNKISKLISAIMYAKLLLVLLAVAIFVISIILIPMVRNNLVIISLYFISSIFIALLPDFYFRGLENMKIITIRTVVVRILTLLLIVSIVKDELQIVYIPIIMIIGNAFGLFLTFRQMLKEGVRIEKVPLSFAILQIKDSFMYYISRMAVSVNQFAASFLLGLKYSPMSVQMGLFSGASKISAAGEMMVHPLSDSLFPHMVNKKDYKLFKRVVVIGGILWCLAIGVIFIFARPLTVFMLGESYADAADILRILLLSTFISFFSNFFGYNALVPLGKGKQANLAIVYSAIYTFSGGVILWATNNINLISVSFLVVGINVVVLVYRVSVFVRARRTGDKI